MSRTPPPRPAVTTPTLSQYALAARDRPDNAWFMDIEESMNNVERSGFEARQRALGARIDMLKSKAELLSSTTRSSVVYAQAVQDAPWAPQSAKDAAARVLSWRGKLDAAMDQVQGARELEDALAAVKLVADAKWSLLEAAMDMSVGGDAVRAYTPAPTPAPAGCPTDHPKVTPGRGTERQRRMLSYLTTKGEEFVAHLWATRPTQVTTKNLLNWSRRIEAMSVLAEATTSTHGITLGKPALSRCIAVAYDSFSSFPRMLTRVLHEFAHVANPSNDAHGPEFYKVFRTFLRIASEELGWTLETTCRETCFSVAEPGYDAAKACPKCVWQTPPGSCKPTARQCEPSQADRDKLMRLWAKDPDMIAFLGGGGGGGGKAKAKPESDDDAPPSAGSDDGDDDAPMVFI